MKYRPQRGELHESMAEVVELSECELVHHLAKELGVELTGADIRIQPYGFDGRIGWNTNLVTVRNKVGDKFVFGGNMDPDYFGAVGYTDTLVRIR